MGGDDLGSDEEYLIAPIQDKEKGYDKPLVLSHDDDEEEISTSVLKKKRKRADNDKDDDDDETTDQQPSHHKKQQLLLETSRNLLELSMDEQATFLLAALAHYTRLSIEEGGGDKSTTSTAHPWLPSKKRMCKFLVQPKPRSNEQGGSSSSSSSFLDRLLGICSRKRLKRHSVKGSPSILIVCQSARRAVAVLKECAPLNTKAAKLFPKQGGLTQQMKECAQSTFGLAVGTPHRLAALCGGVVMNSWEEQDDDENDDAKKNNQTSSKATMNKAGTLRLDATQLVALDAEPSNKKYTVCTLPDTAEWCMKFLQHAVLPQLQKRKDIKLAFC